jgi:hypothetical protein
MQYLRPIPIPCTQCGTPAQPRTFTRRTPTDIITEATWHCHVCQRFLKQGTISSEPIIKT